MPDHESSTPAPVSTIIQFIYFITNPALHTEEGEPLWKIGITNNILQRMRSLYSTGVPSPFQVQYALGFTEGVGSQVERLLHSILEDYRWNPSREFFSIHSDRIQHIVSLLVVMGAQSINVNELEDNLTTTIPITNDENRIWLKEKILWCIDFYNSRGVDTRATSENQRAGYVSNACLGRQINALGDNFDEFKQLLDINMNELTEEQKQRVVILCNSAIESLRNVQPNAFPNASLNTIISVYS